MNHIKTLGVDIAKNVFQLHGCNSEGMTVIKKKLSRKQFIEFMANVKAKCVVMEACSGANHWARRFISQGVNVKLIHANFVKPYLKGNKNDAMDALAICEAASRPDMHFVLPKNIAQQDIQTAHRIRQGYVEERTALGNRIRGLLAEYGIVMPLGINKIRSEVPLVLENAENELTPITRKMLKDLYIHLRLLDSKVKEYDSVIDQFCQQYESCQRLIQVPGIGKITATALYADLGNGAAFKNGRHAAAYLGLVPRQHSSGGRQKLLGISKRGDRYLRTLLIHGGRAILRHAGGKQNHLNQWIQNLKHKKHSNIVAVAIANKLARIAWALLSTGENYKYC